MSRRTRATRTAPPGPRTASRRAVLAATGALATGALAGCQQVLVEDDDFPDGTPPGALQERTRTFVERVESGQYEAATEHFNAEMQSELPPESMEATWDDTVGHLGAYEEISRWGYEEGEENDAVYARVERAEGHYRLQVTFGPDRQIAGVFIRNVAD